ncbi:polymorphic toxin-type HINT domain-containing protein, partial [Kitasatospora sp. NPDC059747]|uniref:polymorphic toxin-type HINT domain-containing protein n=1 Tax=Kitasatospora sp. NPDC059747 TaxID=3346930 RepID=UPI003667A009
LGAREYQPTTGRFLNPDPLLDTGDPQQWNAYAYSNNDPQNLSDPSGLKAEECGQLYDCHGGTITLNNTAETSSYVQSDVQRRYYETFKDDTQNVTNQWVKAQITKHPGVSKPMAVIHDESEFYKGFKHVIKGAIDSTTQSYKDAKGCITGDGQACKSLAVDAFNSIPVVAIIKNDMGLLDTARQMVDQVKNGQGEYTAGEITGLVLIAVVAHKVGERFEGASGPCKNSFPPDTPVLMADGTTKAIGDIRPDDTVTATDPQTGKASPEPVTAKIVTPDDTQFTELTLSTSSGKTSPQANTTLVSTAHHPYWDDTAKTWADAQDLQVGHQLETPDHDLVALLATRTYTTAPQAAHNLTVANLHTYYVLAGTAPILVHNCGGSIKGHSETCSCDPEKPRSEITLDRDYFEAARNTGLDIVGTLDPGTRITLIGRLESAVETFGNVTGFTRRSGGDYREFRLDVDPKKGAHINVMTGKGAGVKKYAIRWPSSTVAPWLKAIQNDE